MLNHFHIQVMKILKLHNETVLNPTAYDNAAFEMLSGTDNCAFRQNPIHGSAPIAIFSSSTKACTFHGDCSIPNVHNKPFIDNIISTIYIDA